MSDILTIGETAQDLGVYRQTITDAIRTLGLQTKPVPRNGNARGLNAQDRAKIRKALNIPAKKTAAAS